MLYLIIFIVGSLFNLDLPFDYVAILVDNSIK